MSGHTTVPFAPNRDCGEGPYEKLIIKNAIMIDGSGAPPDGPVDILIEKNIIKHISIRGLSSSQLENAHVIDASGMYVMPGFVDTHAHVGGPGQGVPAEYVNKLWMAHGVTTIRDAGSINGGDWTLHEKKRSANNEIVAPRIYAYTCFRNWDKGDYSLSASDAYDYVLWAQTKGFDGFKFINRWDPKAMEIVISEAKKQGLGTMAHLSQTTVSRVNALDAATMGLGSLEHWYGLPEALFDQQIIQDYPYDYNYSNEHHRFSEAGRLWKQAAEPYSDHWNEVMDKLLALDFTMSPTLAIYEATRDVARSQYADYHEDYTLPSLWEFFQPDSKSHGSFFSNWTTKNEIDWKENYRLWMTFLNEYKNRGGRICTGSDSGYIYKTYGFGFIRELELLQEAGFHPLEVIRSATYMGAEVLAKENGEPMEFGLIQQNMLADLVIVEENPLHNFKTLYGTGTMKINSETRQPEQVGGVTYTIKDGIVYDAKQLLADVKKMVINAKEQRTS